MVSSIESTNTSMLSLLGYHLLHANLADFQWQLDYREPRFMPK